MYFKLNQLAVISLISVGVVGTASANVYIEHQGQEIYPNTVLTVKSDLQEDQIKNPEYIWKDEKNVIVGSGSQLKVTPEILGNSQVLSACVSYINKLEDTSAIECSDNLSLNNVSTYNLQTKDKDPRIGNTTISSILVGKFIAPTETVTLDFDVFDPDSTTPDEPLTMDDFTDTEYKWFINGTLVHSTTNKNEINYTIPEKYNDGTGDVDVVAGMNLVVAVSVTVTDDFGSGSADDAKPFVIQENYPGGNIADKYYRPMLESETTFDEQPENIVFTNGDGVEVPESASAYGFAALKIDQAIKECNNRGLELVKDATEFSNYMNAHSVAGGETEHWPNNIRMFWSSVLDTEEPGIYFGNYMTVGYDDDKADFEVFSQSPNSLALVVCEDK
ncbi:hypothetical protein [Aliivibrio fischeri]|uniref:hypothetical protein n=1 Tax=Aliivibrio fischeri TaxID=668 RepID=UPI0037367446